MSLPFDHSGKRYYAYAWYLKQKYGGRIAKVPLDGGFTCPNRDGTKGRGGCCYCSAAGSGDFIAAPRLPIEEQFEQYRQKMLHKWTPIGYIPYFQSFTGTYAPIDRLRELYTQAAQLPDVVGLAIATRPDCINDAVCSLLAELASSLDVTVELGVQTIFDDTATRCNLCHTFHDFELALAQLHRIPVSVCVHLINGLPGETPQQMVQSAATIGCMGIDAIKLHALYVLQNTTLAASSFSCLSKEQYCTIVCDQLEVLPPHIIIQRLTGDGSTGDLIAPDWSRNKRAVLGAIDHEMKRRGSTQGSQLWKASSFSADYET